MKSRFKVGDCVLYMDDSGYWKVFKILEIYDNQCRYRCIDIIGRDDGIVGEIGHFYNESLVGRDGIVVNELDYLSYVMAKAL